MSEVSQALPALPIILICGQSGAGQTSAVNVFEDMHFLTVGGIPMDLVPPMFSSLTSEAISHYYKGLAVGLDLRKQDFSRGYLSLLLGLRGLNYDVRLIFLEADVEVLMRRYATTRRPHPLESEAMGLEQTVRFERERLAPLRENADIIIDTSNFSIHDLRRFIQKNCLGIFDKHRNFRVHLISFGFKYGVPAEADMMYDLRFLPNPFFVEELRPQTGQDKAVAEYVLGVQPGKEFIGRLTDFLLYLLPLYESEGRYRVTIALGCTGGRHRSVAVTEAVFKALSKQNYAMSVEHRHLELG